MDLKSADDRTYYCSFCGLSQKEVEKLIAGPMVFICDGCVNICATIVAEDRSLVTARSGEAEYASWFVK